jgi:2-dehydropantoate 2-reductase
MRIVILGSGALGCVFAGYLARGGHDVTVVARQARLAELQGRPVRVGGFAEFEAPVTWASGASAPDADLLVVSVKTFDTAVALDQLAGGQYAAALSIQNGLVKNELLEQHYPGSVLGAATLVGASLSGPAHALHILDGATYVGELDGRPSERAAEIAAAFTQAGLPAEARQDVASVEWSKLCQYAGATFVGASARRHLHEVYLDPDLAALYTRVCREAAEVAHRAGVEVGDFQGFPMATVRGLDFDAAVASVHQRGEAMRARGLTNIRSSMLQAMDAGRPTELEDTAGWLLAAAARFDVAAPTTQTLYRLLRGVTAPREPAPAG